MRRAARLALLGALCVGPAAAEHKPDESRPSTAFVAPFAGDEEILAGELHLVATELFKTELAATRKFVFGASEGDAELVLRGTLGRAPPSGYRLDLEARRGDGSSERIALFDPDSLEDLVKRAAGEVGKLARRTGYVIKRDGARIVIARGSQDGVKVGQRYRTTDTFEVFVIRGVSTQTAEGEILTGPSAPPGSSGKVGSVDVVFVIDTTGSMQEEIDGVLANCQRFADRLAKSGIDARLGLVTFRVGVVSTYEPTADIAQFKSWVAPLRAGGGGDETPFTALQAALRLPLRPEAKRIFVLITDEAAYDALDSARKERSLARPVGCGSVPRPVHAQVFSTGLGLSTLQQLAATRVVVFPVALNDQEGIYPQLGAATGGVYYDLHRSQDFSALLDTLGERIEGMFVEM